MDLRLLFIILHCSAILSYAQSSQGSANVEPKPALLDVDQEDKISTTRHYELSEVHIEATESLSSKSSTSVLVTGKKAMEHQIPLNVSAVLQQHSGFTMKDSYQTPITLRGLSGKRLLTLRNGLRRMSSYPAGYMAHLVNIYDLERIEVEKGYSSVIYGAGAIAGTVNLIDKPLFAHSGFNAKVAYGTASNTKENTVLTCAGWNNEKYALKGGLRYRKADDFVYANGTTADNSAYQDQDFFFATGFKLSDKETLSLSGDWHNGGPWGKAVGFNGSDYMKINTPTERSHNYQVHYQKQNEKHSCSYDIKGFYSNERRQLQKAYYTAANNRLSYTETTDYADVYYGSKAMGTYRPTSQYTLELGVEGYAYHISTPTDGTDYIADITFSNRISHNARLYQGALFAEHTYSLSSRMQLKGGLRYDEALLYEGEVYDTTAIGEQSKRKHAFSGHLAWDYRIGASRLKVNLARAFRMPSINELYTDSYTANGIVYATPSIKAEYCNSLDISYHYYSDWGAVELSPFVWMMDDMISKQELRGRPGTNYQYINIGQALLTGGELNVTIPFYHILNNKDRLSFESGAAYLYGNDITDREHIAPLDYIPPFNLKSVLHYQCPIGQGIQLKWSLRSTFYSEQKRLGSEGYATPSYINLASNITLNFVKIKTQPTLNITINNLTNENYYAYMSYLPSPGRNLKLMLSFHM